MKKKRHEEILSIIDRYEIENQEMLQEELKKRGYNVTQATISRDINELRLEKVLSDNGINCYVRPAGYGMRHTENIFQQSVISTDYAMNTVCLKCKPGLASAACATFDVMPFEGVVGTIAGDDTIFILMRTEKDAKSLCIRLNEIISL